MDEILRDTSPQAVIAAIEANLSEEMAAFGRYYPGAELHEDAEIEWFISGLPSTLFNGVLRTRFDEETADAKIDQIIALFTARNVPISWGVGTTERPTDLATRLEARGFVLVQKETGMAADLLTLDESGTVPGSFTIVEVNNLALLKQYAHVSMRGFNNTEEHTAIYLQTYTNIGFGPHLPWRHFLGFLDGEPVATSSLLLHAGVAGVYGVATIPEARRKGIGAAMTLAPLRLARSWGYQLGILSPSEMGLNVYQRLGFREYCTVRIYARGL
jgi:GNAT superfamily N-acetyltransferase